MKKITYKLAGIVSFAWFFLIAAAVVFPQVNSSFAQTSTSVSDNSTTYADKNALSAVMCNILKIVTGTAGKTFAAFAIVSIGVGFFTGKVSWGLMIGVAAGISAMFGAATIVSAITGKDTANCDNVYV